MSRPVRGKGVAKQQEAAAAPSSSSGPTSGTSSSSSAFRAEIKQKNDFLVALESYTPTIPEALTRYYVQKSGVNALDERMIKLISLASDHFLAKTVHEAKQMSLLKQAPKAKGTKRKAPSSSDQAGPEDTMELEDLERALTEAGVFIRKG